MNPIERLEVALDALEGAMGAFYGAAGRRVVERRIARRLDRRFGRRDAMRGRGSPSTPQGNTSSSPTPPEGYYVCAECGYSPALSERIVAFVAANPGASVRDVRDGVTGRAQDIGATIATLVDDGRLEDRGGRARELYARGSDRLNGSGGNRPGTLNSKGSRPRKNNSRSYYTG